MPSATLVSPVMSTVWPSTVTVAAARSTAVTGPTSLVVTLTVVAVPAPPLLPGVPVTVATWPTSSDASVVATPSIVTVALPVAYSSPSTKTLPKPLSGPWPVCLEETENAPGV